MIFRGVVLFCAGVGYKGVDVYCSVSVDFVGWGDGGSGGHCWSQSKV